MKEIWKDIKDYDGKYKISNFGEVKSFKDNEEKALKKGIDSSGYFCVKLYKNKKTTTVGIHRLVWDHFGDTPRNGRKLQIDHIDDIKTNNRIDNFQLLTNRQNCSKGKLLLQKTSKYTGVCWDKNRKKWISKIQINGGDKYLGRFIGEHDAHIAYQNELKKIEVNSEYSI